MRASDSERLERAIADVLQFASRNKTSPEELSWIAQIMAVWASGYLEASCREALLAYAKTSSSPGVYRYVDHQLKFFRSPKTNDMLELIGLFDGGAAEDLREFADGQIKASIDSIVTYRHSLAHGRSAQVTVHRVRAYFDDAKRFTGRMRSLLGA